MVIWVISDHLFACSLFTSPSAGSPIIPLRMVPVIFTSLLMSIEFCDKTVHVFAHSSCRSDLSVIVSAPTTIFMHAELFSCMQNRIFFLNTLNNKLICWWNQDQIDVAVKQLLALKVQFKKLTGQDYKPGMPPPTSAPPATSAAASSSTPSGLYERVAQQGENVRKLKSEKAPKVSWHREHLTLWFSFINIESKDSWLCITVCWSWSKYLTCFWINYSKNSPFLKIMVLIVLIFPKVFFILCSNSQLGLL